MTGGLMILQRDRLLRLGSLGSMNLRPARFLRRANPSNARRADFLARFFGRLVGLGSLGRSGSGSLDAMKVVKLVLQFFNLFKD